MDIAQCLLEAESDRELEEVQRLIEERGYSAFNELLEYLKQQLKLCDESTWSELEQSLKKAREIIPNPGEISPSWTYIWRELNSSLVYKNELLQRIPPHQRDGEWQVIMDNPYTNEHIVCYPGLSFLEAAYLYAYFRPELKNNEYIRVQKVVELMVMKGTAHD